MQDIYFLFMRERCGSASATLKRIYSEAHNPRWFHAYVLLIGEISIHRKKYIQLHPGTPTSGEADNGGP